MGEAQNARLPLERWQGLAASALVPWQGESGADPGMDGFEEGRKMDRGVRESKRPDGKQSRAGKHPCTGDDPHILWATGLVPRHVGAENVRAPRVAPRLRL